MLTAIAPALIARDAPDQFAKVGHMSTILALLQESLDAKCPTRTRFETRSVRQTGQSAELARPANLHTDILPELQHLVLVGHEIHDLEARTPGTAPDAKY